jgi:hypothetical protein
MPAIWALQGLFLFAILIVCGASYPIERFYSVNLAAFVIGIAVLAVVVVAPAQALYRNTYPMHEGRNFYRKAAEELTRRWHAVSDAALPLVGGDEDLAFALAFYSPDHPRYEVHLVNPGARGMPCRAVIERGWAALCFGDDPNCIAGMEAVAAKATRFVKSDFVVQSSLLGLPGASQRFTAVMVPPATEPAPSGMAEEFSAIRRNTSTAF